MQKNQTTGLGMSKHRKSGASSSNTHFTGKKAKGSKKKKREKTRKQRRLNRGTHENKYK